MDEFGQHVRKFDWDFSRAKEIMLFCNGPWCDQSPRAIRGLVKLGYPVNKIHYYRGGMQDWLLLGLSVEVPTLPPAAAKPTAAR
jgi:rhodanese-related sulfurtransferase